MRSAYRAMRKVWRMIAPRGGTERVFHTHAEMNFRIPALPRTRKDESFYNTESAQYSSKRYPPVASTYVQAFFKRRLSITLEVIERIPKSEPLSVLEIGCADGVVLRALRERFGARLGAIQGIDIAQEMIARARELNRDFRTTYAVRREYVERPIDLVIETGVLNYAGVEDISYAARQLKEGGWYVLSLAGTGSIIHQLDLVGGFKDVRSYREYEALIREEFEIVAVRGCGFFVPYLWRVPALARLLQPYFEGVFGLLLPNLCHEKVYLVKKAPICASTAYSPAVEARYSRRPAAARTAAGIANNTKASK